jgi:hypothetical protein
LTKNAIQAAKAQGIDQRGQLPVNSLRSSSSASTSVMDGILPSISRHVRRTAASNRPTLEDVDAA